MNTATHITDRLETHGIRPTRQRVDVARVLLSAARHLSADQILDELRASGCRVSRATVYNTLSLFTRQGLIRELSLDPERVVYDSTASQHHHFYLPDTGELIDISADSVSLADLPPVPEGCEIDSVEVLVRLRRKD